LHEKYDLLTQINFNNFIEKKWVEELFDILRVRKYFYNIKKVKFDEILTRLDPETDNSLISYFFYLIYNDEELISCLTSSWKFLPEKLLIDLSKSRYKIPISSTIKNLQNKNLESTKKIFKKIEEILFKSANNNSQEVVIFDNKSDDPFLISFPQIFEFDVDKILALLLSEVYELSELKFLIDKKKEYQKSNHLYDTSIISNINRNLDSYLNDGSNSIDVHKEKLSISANLISDERILQDVINFFIFHD